MAGLHSLVIGYLALTHALLYASSPYYRHEVSRALHGIKTAVVAHSSRSNDAKLPKSGVYASTDLLRVVQQQMLWGDQQQGHSGPGTNASAAVPASVYSTRHNRLIAYLSATDLLHGEGWKARAAFFVFLLAPRYVLTSTGGKFAPEIQLLVLASKDLPAVGLLQRSEDPSAGYLLSCTSPALSMGLGPQPFAHCSVWMPDPSAAAAAAADSSQQLRSSMRARAAAAAAAAAGSGREPEPAAAAAAAAAEAGSQPVGGDTSSSSSSGSGGLQQQQEREDAQAGACSAEQQQQQQKQQQPVATWVILPDSTPEDVAQQLQDIGDPPQEYLSGARFRPSEGSRSSSSSSSSGGGGGWMSSFLDVWLFFPRAPLLQVLPAMTSGLQMAQYGYAVLALSFSDLLQMARFMQALQNRVVNSGQLMGQDGWAYIMAGVSIMLQMLLSTCVRAGLAAAAAYVCAALLLLLARGVAGAAAVLQGPLLHVLAFAAAPRAGLAATGALALTFLAGLRLQDVACLLLWDVGCVLLLGLVFAYLAEVRRWDENRAAVVSMLLSLGVLVAGQVAYLAAAGPALVLPAAGVNSKSVLVRWAARATQAAAAAAGGGSSAAAAAAAGGGGGVATAAVAQAAAAVRGLLLPWQGMLLALHGFCEDAVMLTVALLVWEGLGPLGDLLWKGCVEMAVEAGVVLECLGSCLLLLLSGGGSLRQAWTRFWVHLQQRMQQQEQQQGFGLDGEGDAAAGMAHAHLVIRAPAAAGAFADVGHTADALRALADELENLGDGGGGGGQGEGEDGGMQLMQGGGGGPMFLNGRLVVARGGVRGPKLGSHWPAPLEIPFDIDDVRDELGLEVPRGFICPLTLDIMRQPALLISSNIAVPSSYDKEAIARWLEDNRRDPKSRRVLASDAQLVPNFDLYRSIEDWAAHTQALHAAHRQQHQQHTAAAAAGPSNAGKRQGGHVSAAAGAYGAQFGPQSAEFAAQIGLGERGAAAGQQQVPRAVGRAPGRQQQQQQQQASSASLSGLLAAAGGAIRGTAAAAAAAAAAATGGRGRGRGHNSNSYREAGAGGRGGTAAAAGFVDPNEIPLASDTESEGGSSLGDGGSDSLEGPSWSDDAEEEDADAVHSHPSPAAAAAAAAGAGAVGRGGGSGRGGAIGSRQGTPGAASGGRYNLRQRRAPGM